jgi:hypothetical protein
MRLICKNFVISVVTHQQSVIGAQGDAWKRTRGYKEWDKHNPVKVKKEKKTTPKTTKLIPAKSNKREAKSNKRESTTILAPPVFSLTPEMEGAAFLAALKHNKLRFEDVKDCTKAEFIEMCTLLGLNILSRFKVWSALEWTHNGQ